MIHTDFARAGTLDKIQRKIDHAFNNARRLNQPRNVKHESTKTRRRIKKWMRNGFAWQERNIRELCR